MQIFVRLGLINPKNCFEMSRYLCIAFLFLLVIIAGCQPSSPAGSQESVNILFIGNSYTFMNDMPGIFASLAESGGYDANVMTVAKAGYSLHDHTVDPETKKIIQENHWDYVILQEKSALSIVDRDLMTLGVNELKQYIVAQDAEAILFLPWAYKAGFSEAGLENYEAMQSKVTANYLDLADNFGLTVAPVGIAWQSAQDHNPALNLWGFDGKHPSLAGSYLAAVTLYMLIFQEKPSIGELHEELPLNGDSLKIIIETANETVLEYKGKWVP